MFLNFWGTWCEPCKEEMPHIEKMSQEYKEKGVEILAVNVGESDFQVRTFMEQYKLTFPIAIDSSKEVQKAYSINPLPTTFMISPEGKWRKLLLED